VLGQVTPLYLGLGFTGKFRDECLNMEVFYSLAGATTIVESWRHNYNYERPHGSLGYQTHAEFAASWRLVSGTIEQPPQQNQMSLSL
jgi:transposase InsO family protein